jgi:antitoxin VapB
VTAAAITDAIRERPKPGDCAQDATSRVNRVTALAKEIRAHMSEPVSSDHGWLYDDETGLPK